VRAAFYLHSVAGKSHRDIKPNNIMLQGGNPACPVLIDLGEGNDIDSNGHGASTLAGALEYRDLCMLSSGYDPRMADLNSLPLTTVAIAIGVDVYEKLTDCSWIKMSEMRMEAFNKASKVLVPEAVQLLRRITDEYISHSYREIFQHPWVVQGWNEIKYLQHYASSLPIEQ
jgi:serine/threonine protein kinase